MSPEQKAVLEAALKWRLVSNEATHVHESRLDALKRGDTTAYLRIYKEMEAVCVEATKARLELSDAIDALAAAGEKIEEG